MPSINGEWKNEIKICEGCQSVFSPNEKTQKVGWERQRFCSRPCVAKNVEKRKPVMKKTVLDRFWEKVDKSAGHGPWGDCWVWTASTMGNCGYGGFYSGECKNVYTHRYSYFIHHGELNGLDVLHRCDNRKCVNPAHLFLGTHQENMMDMVSKKRQAWGSQVGSAKLTEDDVRAIRSDPRRHIDIAEQYGCSATNIGLIKQRKKWGNLPD